MFNDNPSVTTSPTRIIATGDGWMSVTDLPVTQPVPLAEILERQYPFVAAPEPDGGFSIRFPDLPGCTSFAETWEQIGAQARETSALWLEGSWYDNYPIPEPTYEWEPFRHDFSGAISRIDGLPTPAYEKVYTAEEAAEALDISRNRVQQLARAAGVGTKINNARLFTESEVTTLRNRADGRRRRPGTLETVKRTIATSDESLATNDNFAPVSGPSRPFPPPDHERAASK